MPTLGQCWYLLGDINQDTLSQCWFESMSRVDWAVSPLHALYDPNCLSIHHNTILIIILKLLVANRQTRDVHLLLVQCLPVVYDPGSTLNQHWFNVWCLLGNAYLYILVNHGFHDVRHYINLPSQKVNFLPLTPKIIAFNPFCQPIK